MAKSSGSMVDKKFDVITGISATLTGQQITLLTKYFPQYVESAYCFKAFANSSSTFCWIYVYTV